MPVLLGRVVPQPLLQPLGDDVPSIRHHDIGDKFLQLAFIQRSQEGVEVLDRDARHGLIGHVLAQPCEMFIHQLGSLALELVNEGLLPCHHHPLRIFPQAGNQTSILTLIDVQPIVTLYDTHFGELLRRKAEKGFRHRHIDVNRSFTVVVHRQQSLVDKAVAMPLLLPRMDFRQGDRTLHQTTEYPVLRQCLPVHLPYPRCGTVGRDDHQRNLLVIRLRHSRMDVKQRRSGSAADGSRLPTVQSQPDGKEAGIPFIRHRMASEEGMARQCLYNRYVAAARAQHDVPYLMLLEQGGQLQHVLFI